MKIKKNIAINTKEITQTVDVSRFFLTLDTALCLIVDKCRLLRSVPIIEAGTHDFEQLVVSIAILSFEKDYLFQKKTYYWSMEESLKIFDAKKTKTPLTENEKKFWFK